MSRRWVSCDLEFSTRNVVGTKNVDGMTCGERFVRTDGFSLGGVELRGESGYDGLMG